MFKKVRLIFFAVLIASTILSTAFVKSNLFEITKNLEVFVNVFRELNAYYVDDIDPDKFVRSGIDAMLGSLDPYTSFISEEDMAGYKMQTTGKYGGVGALIRKGDDYVIIAEPYEGFPAHDADLRAGDKIIKIEGKSVKGKTTDDISKLLKGTPGTNVKMSIERYGAGKTMEKTIKREEIKINSVPYAGMVNNKTAYFRLNTFTENCSEELINALDKLKENGKVESVILDLRGNPGGLLNEAINVANIFIPKKELVVSTKGRKQESDKDYKTSKEPIDTDIPLAVLIDRGSASASEIVAGVVQDLDRGVVIGQRSYGKGLVQTTKNIGYNSKVKLTTAKYYLPSGRCIQSIDYSGGYNDNLGKIPDSLRTAFKTKKGRTVYDAGGVDPDIDSETELFGNITRSLLMKQLIFDYATEYREKNASIPTPDKFELTDADYADFVKFLGSKDYDYVTESEQLLKDLKESAEKDKYYDAIKGEIDELEAKIKHDKQKDLDKFKTQIKQLLEYEIVLRYHFQKGEIQETLEDDPDVKEALRIIENTAEYNKILSRK